jgi:spore coat protein U-like protein
MKSVAKSLTFAIPQRMIFYMKSRIALLGALACIAGARALLAATATTTFTVTATVGANCTITATAISLAYDPVVANASTAASTTGTIAIACTKGSGPSIGLSVGGHGGAVAGVTRAMANGSNLLGYELYQPAAAPGNGGVWTDIAGANPLNAGVSPSKAARNYTVTAIVPAAQDVAVGTYSDTVTATVNF